jgi:hypothetical protein
MLILVSFKPVVIVLGFLSAMIFCSYFTSCLPRTFAAKYCKVAFVVHGSETMCSSIGQQKIEFG